MKPNEEHPWGILILLFEYDYILFLPDYIAKTLFSEGYTDIEHIKQVFFDEVLPICLLSLIFEFAGSPFDELLTAIAIRRYKESIISQIVMKRLMLFFFKNRLV